MSGIAGIFYRNHKPVQLEQLQAMGAALAHRGPDGIHYYPESRIKRTLFGVHSQVVQEQPVSGH